MIKLPLVFYEKDLQMNSSLCENLKYLVFYVWLVKIVFFFYKIQILGLHLFWDGGSIVKVFQFLAQNSKVNRKASKSYLHKLGGTIFFTR
jgi:hypothetical protein